MRRIACALRSPLLANPSLTRWGLAVCKVPCSHVAILGLPRRRWESSLSPSSPAAGVDGEQEEGVADGQLLAEARPSPAARSPRYMRGRADAAPHSRPRFWKGMGEEEEAWMQLGGDERPPGPVGSLGRAGNLPAAYPPKRKNERRRSIKRELQRQRNATRRVAETAAANRRRNQQRVARQRVAVAIAQRKIPPNPAQVAARQQARLAQENDAEFYAWASENFGENPFQAPPGKGTKGVGLVN